MKEVFPAAFVMGAVDLAALNEWVIICGKVAVAKLERLLAS